jgi:cellulose biosynthesis protein BcsQ
MIRLVVSNQRGGVAKTTTAITIASLFAEQASALAKSDPPLLAKSDPVNLI